MIKTTSKSHSISRGHFFLRCFLSRVSHDRLSERWTTGMVYSGLVWHSLHSWWFIKLNEA